MTNRRLTAAIACLAVVSGISAPAALAAPAIRSISTASTSTSSSSLTVPAPANLVAGDVMLTALAVRLPALVPISPPTGWTLIRRDNNDPLYASLAQALYFKVVGVSEPTSYTWSWKFSQPVGAAAGILAYSGVDALAPIDAHSGRYRAMTNQIVAPSVTTTAGSDRVAAFFAHNGTKTTASPSGTEDRYDETTKGGSSSNLRAKAADFVASVAGATGDKVAVTSGSGSSSNIGQLVALRPALGIAPLTQPLNISPPTITGLAVEGQTLTANPGLWSSPEAVTYAYEWRRCDSAGARCVAIAGATAQSYLLTAGDVGFTLRVVVTAMNSAGVGSATSEHTAVVAAKPAPPVNTALPTISGTPQAGQVLSTTTGTWTGEEPISYVYQWRRCDSSGGGCASISGAVAATYQATSSDVGFTLRVVVTASNAGGSTSATSAPTAVVTTQPPPPPPAEPGAFPTSLYTASSPWNTPLTGFETLESNSSQMIQQAISQSSGGFSVIWKRFGVAGFYADRTTPTYTVRNTAYNTQSKLQGVPIPSAAWPAGGDDGHMAVVMNDPLSGRHGCGWSWISAGTTSTDGPFDFSDPRGEMVQRHHLINEDGWIKGASVRGSSAEVLAGAIRPSELQAGKINHAIGVYVPQSRREYDSQGNRVSRLRSYTSDGTGQGTQYVPEGARLRLPASFDASGLAAHWQTVARALKTYGAYVIDNSGNAVHLLALDNSHARSIDHAIAYPWGTTTYPTVPSSLIQKLEVLSLEATVRETYNYFQVHPCGDAVSG
jgi:hypothetical protein